MVRTLVAKRNLEELYELARASAKLWGIDAYPQFVGNSENIVYKIKSKYLRLVEDSHRSFNLIRAEMAFIEYLQKKNISVVKPIASLKGKMVEQMRGVSPYFNVCMFEKISGQILAKNELYKDIKYAEKLGRYLGNIHQQSLNYRPVLPWLKRYKYRNCNIIKGGFDILPVIMKKARMELENALSWYDSLPIEKDSYGLIHSDVHGKNIAVDRKGNISLIDFDDCAYNFLAYDLAVPLYYMQNISLSEDFKEDFTNKFISSYLSTYPLPKKWINILSGFIRLRNIELYIWKLKMLGGHDDAGNIIPFKDFSMGKVDLKCNYPKL